ALVVASLEALRVPAPRGHRVRIALAGLTLAATVRVVDRIHRKTAHCGTYTAPTLRAGLSVTTQVVLVVAHFADRGATVDVHLARLSRLQTHIGINAFACRERHGAAGAAGELSASTRLQLDVVHDRAHGNVAQCHRIAGLDRSIG